jgi:tetratricopeptide (TPR) repeat protein
MTSRQKIIILLAVVLAVLLYSAPKIASEKKLEAKEDSNFASQFEEAKKNLTPEQKTIFDRLERSLKKAQTVDNEEVWISSANDFLKGARFLQNEKKAVLYKGAIKGFEKVLVFNPNNLKAKTGLGSSIVESSSLLGNQPMKGITLLREVIQKDSNNIEANLQLGLFSVTSRQFDKAIERFQRILRIDSTHIDMYVYLGDTYLTMEEKQNAIENYEKYKARVKDTLIAKNIDGFIKKLKNQP